MAYCGKCGTKLNDGAKFCPKCGTPSRNRTNICPKCGNQLMDGVKFCPKCGVSVANKTEETNKWEELPYEYRGLSEKSSKFINESSHTSISKEKGGSGNKYWKYTAFILCLLAFFYIYGTYDNSSSNNHINTEKIVETTNIRKSTPKQEEKLTMQTDEEFKRKTMEYVNQIQQIMVQMNNVLNSGRYFAGADLFDLKLKGDKIFEKMISLARKKKYQEAVAAFKQEKKNFDDQWHEMDKIVNRDLYNY